MKKDFNGDTIELYRIMNKSLYFGMMANVIVPMGLLLACYFFDQRYHPANKLGDFANTLFFIFLILGATQGAFAFWWRQQLLLKPMIRRKETFQIDLALGLTRISRPVFMLIGAISLYGVFYFFLTGRFEETMFMVILSFIVFQVVRPRYGLVSKLIDNQYAMAEKGEFYRERQQSGVSRD